MLSNTSFEPYSNKIYFTKGTGGIFKLITFPMEDSLSEAIALDINQIKERSDTCLSSIEKKVKKLRKTKKNWEKQGKTEKNM